MRKEITEYYCDLCGEKEDMSNMSFHIAVPTFYNFDDTEERPCDPYIKVTYHDLCSKCLLKVTVVKGEFHSERLKLREHK